MTGKRRSKGKTAGRDPNKLMLTERPGEDRARTMADLALSGALANTITARQFSTSAASELDINTALEVVRGHIAQVQKGDTGNMEALLTAQALSLDAIFNAMMHRAALNMGQHTQAAEMYLRMGLRAQANCRTTVETLAEIKNPRSVAFVKQANIAQGHQQVNNGVPAPLRAREIESEQTQLSRGNHELLPDARASGLASRVDPALETLGEIDRAEIPRG